MEMPLSEMMDRYSILLLKKERLPKNTALAKECARYQAELGRHPDQAYIREALARLSEINMQIWDLEADIRQGKEGNLDIEEVGRRALAIRDLNAERIRQKNYIAQHEGEFSEIKVDHASGGSTG